MIKESKHPIARALFVDKSDLADREKEDLEFVDKLLSKESRLFASRYEILSVISSDSQENDENVNNLNTTIKSQRLTRSNRQPLHHSHHQNLNVHKSHKSKHQHIHHPYLHNQHYHHNHHHHHHHHNPVVNNVDESTHLVNDTPGTVTASYLAFIMWQILLRSKQHSW